MKNKERNRKQQKIYRRRRIALVCILVLLAVILIVSIQSKLNLKKIALGENALNIGGEEINLNQVFSNDPNPPQLGARNDTNKMEWRILGNNDCRQ